VFACGVEHGDHVLEVHAGAVKRRHRQGKVRVADLDGDRQVLEKLHEVGSAGARRQAEVAGLIEDAVHRVGHFGRDVAHLAVLERAGGQVVDVLVVVLGAVEMDRVDEAACVRTVDLAEDLTLLLDGRDVASGHRLDAEVEAVRMGELAEFGVVVRQAVDVGVVACAEHLIGGRDVENGEGGQTDRTRKLQWLVAAVLERDGGDLRGGGTLKEAAAIRKHDVFLLG